MGRADVSSMGGNAMKTYRLDTFFCMKSVFGIVFFYALTVGLLIQLVILPFVSPELNGGYGLLKGADWVGFQEEAVRLAVRIRHEGWGLWELRPQGNAPIGIAAAIYAATGYTEPWVLMPLNAGLFALGATCLYAIFTLLASRHMAFIAIAPYVFFPSAAMIYAQIHKDVWSIAGLALNVLAWGRFAVYPTMNVKDLGIQFVLTFAGAMLVWLVRPYLVPIILTTSVLTMFVLVCRMLIWREKDIYSRWWWIGGVASVLLLVFVGKLDTAFQKAAEVPLQIVPSAPDVTARNTPDATVEKKRDISVATVIQTTIDAFLLKFINTRQGFSTGYPEAGSNIDTEKNVQSLTDVIRYIPRALQIGLLAPFPDRWAETGVSPGATYMRRFAAMEMGMTYLILPGIIFLFMRGRPHGATIVTLIQSIIPVIILAMVITNVGTLYRMRYLNLQILNGLGLLGWMMWYHHFNSRHKGINV